MIDTAEKIKMQGSIFAEIDRIKFIMDCMEGCIKDGWYNAATAWKEDIEQSIETLHSLLDILRKQTNQKAVESMKNSF